MMPFFFFWSGVVDSCCPEYPNVEVASELVIGKGRILRSMIAKAQTALRRLLVERQKLNVFLVRSQKEIRHILFETGGKTVVFIK